MVIRGLLVGAVFVGIGVGFTACSSDPETTDDGGTTPTSTTTTTTPTSTTTTTTTTPPGTDSSIPQTDSSTGDSSTGTDSGTDAAVPDGATAPTWTMVHAIITAKCTGTCHNAANNNGGLRMNNKAAAYNALVGVDATTACGAVTTKRITASNAALSKLFLKVSGAPPANCGARMPLNMAVLPAGEIATIQGWINAGALNN